MILLEFEIVQSVTRLRRFFSGRDGLILSASLVIQLCLGVLFGDAYDMRIFMASGYLVAHGLNPYIPVDLSGVFHNNSFIGITSIGYPPTWALITGLIYLETYHFSSNFLLYNLGLKIPIIAANLWLAFLVRRILNEFGVEPKRSYRAWIFLLFNPFLLLTSAGWGQFDLLIALLVLYSIYFIGKDRIALPAILLALANSLKPTALPIVLIGILYLATRSVRHAGRFLVIFLVSLIVICAGPFILFRWSLEPILAHWNFQFSVGGAMSFMTFLEYVRWSYTLPEQWWFLGWLWVPALGIALFTLRKGVFDFKDLLLKSLGLTLVFFLSRSWLSETNLNLILPVAVILAATGDLEPRMLTALWVIPLIFSFFNTDLAQLLFPSMPNLMDRLLQFAAENNGIRYILRTIVVAVWLFIGSLIAWRCLRLIRPSELDAEPGPAILKA